MRKVLAAMMAAMILLCASSAMAAFMDPVSIWAVDCFDADSGSAGQDGYVILAAAGSSNGTLEYSLNQTDWYGFSVTGTSMILGMSSCKEEVLLHFEDTSGVVYDSGTLTFIGDPGACCSLPVYNAVTIDWGSGVTELSFLSTSNGCDKLAPVPIPAAAIMLFFVILGLFGVRRMWQDS